MKWMKWAKQGGWKEGGKVVDIYSAQEVQGESAPRSKVCGQYVLESTKQSYVACGGATGMNVIEGR